MYILYAYKKGEWKEFARFSRSEGYAEQVEKAASLKKTDEKSESIRNAALVMESFVLGNFYYGKEYGKLVMRALRHFDEVGISNDVQSALEESLDEGIERFALAKADEDISSFAEGKFTVSI